MKRAARALVAGLIAVAVGCSIYDSSLLVSAGPDSSVGEEPPPALEAAADAMTATGPSCVGEGVGVSTGCGADESGSCCTSVPVPGGPFVRNRRDGGQAELSPFSLDKYEVTVARFRKFVEAGLGTQLHAPGTGAGTNPHIPQTGWNPNWTSMLPMATADLTADLKCDVVATWTDQPLNNEALPINCISWFEAFAFCAWDGGRLPTDAEWDFAAEGGDAGRYYPWSPPGSETIMPSNASYLCNATGASVFYDAGPDADAVGDNLVCTLADITRPGHYSPQGDGRWGHSDLAGNMWEWVLDWNYQVFTRPCINCATIIPEAIGDAALQRVQRGGAYDAPAEVLVTAEVFEDPPESVYDDDGVRCARGP